MPTPEEKKRAIELLISHDFLVGPDTLAAIDNEEIIKKIINLPNDCTESEIREMLRSQGQVKIIKSFKEEANKKCVDDFTSYFNVRYSKLKEILQKKQELQDVLSIKRVAAKTEKEKVSIIGMIYEKSVTKNNNIMFTLEDPTGQIRVVVNKNRADVFKMSEDCVCDEVIGITGVSSKNIIFVDNIILPEIPATNELKKGPEDDYAIFIGDNHVGSKHFLHENFQNFINWLNGNLGSEDQKEIAKKVKYLFIVGDLVDGIGIYPTQYSDLDIKDIGEQYSKLIEDIKKIPSSIQIIVCPGNHDALRLTEPQPPIYQDYAGELFEMQNVHMVSNPAVVNIGATTKFQGFNVLLYHGASFHFYAEHVESIRKEGGHTRADLIMKFLLQRRHLAPEHSSVSSTPVPDSDPLLIDIIPDFFVTGHIHRSTVSSYRNVTTLNCSCWIGMTNFQEKVGLIPEPSRAVAVNLQTRETKVMKF
jgi:DNA polymerase II small subunit